MVARKVITFSSHKTTQYFLDSALMEQKRKRAQARRSIFEQ